MIRTTFVTIALLAATPALAQQTVCTTTCNYGTCTSVCTPLGPAITHRVNPEAERALRNERRYYDDAYDYELRRLDQENRR